MEKYVGFFRENRMLRLNCIATTSLIMLAAATASQAAIIFDNPITGTNPNTSDPYTSGQTVDSNVTVSGIGRGTGIAGTNANDRYNANSWNTAGLDADAYFYWTLDANNGYEIDFTNLVYTGQASGSGPASFAFRSSVDGYTSDIGTPSATGTTIDLSAAAYQNLTAPVTFRMYGWGASGAAGTFSINSFTFNGSVVSIPEPTTLAALAGIGLMVTTRRRRST